jgi:hypothetical protein
MTAVMAIPTRMPVQKPIAVTRSAEAGPVSNALRPPGDPALLEDLRADGGPRASFALLSLPQPRSLLRR